MASSRGQFISFEGVEGVGKTTQIIKLVDFLRAKGKEVLVTREPGGTALGEDIRKILKFADYGDTILYESEALLFAAARAQLVREVILPALCNGTVVISDRFTDSSIAYQGIGRGLGKERIAEINYFATGGLEPDWTVLLDLDPEIGFRRTRSRESENGAKTDRMETMELKFYQNIRECYLQIAKFSPERVSVISAETSKEEITKIIQQEFCQRFLKGSL